MWPQSADEMARVPSQRGLQWLRLLPVLVLVAAIGTQAFLMLTINADPQSGSGFTMFSSVDFAGSRAVAAHTTAPDGSVIVLHLPPSANDAVDQLLITPTNGLAQDLAQDLATQSWTLDSGLGTSGGDQELQSITVLVRGLKADGRELTAQVLATGSTP